MDTGFREHAGVGLIGAVAVAFLLVGQGVVLALLLAGLFWLSSILPDVDSPVSRPRRMFRGALLVALAVGAGLAYSYFSPICTSNCEWIPVLLAVGIFVMLAAIESFIPPHRKLLHSPLAALGWGIGIGLFGGWLAGIVAAAGYATHLIVDFIGDRL